jgi:hypothetical protein
MQINSNDIHNYLLNDINKIYFRYVLCGVGIDELTIDNEQLKIFPNPVEELAVIRWQLAVNSNVSINVYDITGRKVEALVTNERQQAGEHMINYNAGKLKNGIYIVKIEINNEVKVGKIVKN